MVHETSPLTYADTGVDVDIEAKGARILYQAAKQTWANRLGTLGEVIVPEDNFSGLRYIKIDRLPQGTVMYGGSDGIATKCELYEKVQRFDTAAFDLFAMICDDAVIKGGEPVVVQTVLEVNTLGKDESRLRILEELGKGYIEAAREANVAVINGEIAQLNDRVGNLGDFSFNWNGSLMWFGHESRLISGFEVIPGDLIVGFQERGVRSNGVSLLRMALKEIHGDKWHEQELGSQKLIDLALSPSRIYTPAILEMTGGWSLERPARAELHGAAHITGGGIPEKLGRALKPSGLGAIIDDPFDPPEIFLHCQNAGISDYEAYRTWNMGQGMVLIAPDSDVVIKICQDFGVNAKVIGRVTEKPGIVVQSKGLQGGELYFG